MALSLALLLLGASPAPTTAAPVRSGTVVFGGDIVPHADLLSSFAAHGADQLFRAITPTIRGADLAIANFETPAAASRPLTPTVIRFNVHPDFVQAVAAAGFDATVIANNHSFDMGIPGVGETVTALRSAGIRVVGGALANEDPMSPQEFPLAGSTLCVFSVTRLLNYEMVLPTNAQPHIAMARPEVPSEQDALLGYVRRARTHCGAIIVSLHSGVEYQDRPEAIDRVFFRRLADAGADVVVAHHSHTVQPIELYETAGRQVPIFYSLGNLVSNQGYSADSEVSPRHGEALSIGLDPRLREGILAVLRFEAGGEHGLRLAEFGYVPLWTVNTHWRIPYGEAPTITAGLMPREGGGDHLLTARWQAVTQRAGAAYLLPEASVPGARESYQLGTAAALANRHRGDDASSTHERAESPARSQR